MNQIGSDHLAGFNPTIPPAAYDPAEADKLLAEAGYPDGFALTVTCFSGRLLNDARVCQALGQMLQRVGMKMTVDVEPYQVLVTRNLCHCADRPSFFIATWSSAYVGEVLGAQSNIMHSYDKTMGRASWNLGEYSNPEVDGLLDKAETTTDDKERFRLEGEAMKIAMADVFVLPLHIQGVTLAARKGLHPTPVQQRVHTLADCVLASQ